MGSSVHGRCCAGSKRIGAHLFSFVAWSTLSWNATLPCKLTVEGNGPMAPAVPACVQYADEQGVLTARTQGIHFVAMSGLHPQLSSSVGGQPTAPPQCQVH